MKQTAFRVLGALALLTVALSATPVRVTITNTAPVNGTLLTPVWVGFHNGTFVVYTPGLASSAALEALAEDGNNAPITALFGGTAGTSAQGTLGGAPIAPGQSVSMIFDLDPTNPLNRYFSYASMILPSNDAFIGNGNPLAFEIFNGAGVFQAINRNVMGSMVNDSGTEVNDELAATTAFFSQAAPNTGTVENGVVGNHVGFVPGGRILTQFTGANFEASGYQVANIQIELVPEPTSVSLVLVGVAGLWMARRKRA